MASSSPSVQSPTQNGHSPIVGKVFQSSSDEEKGAKGAIAIPKSGRSKITKRTTSFGHHDAPITPSSHRSPRHAHSASISSIGNSLGMLSTLGLAANRNEQAKVSNGVDVNDQQHSVQSPVSKSVLLSPRMEGQQLPHAHYRKGSGIAHSLSLASPSSSLRHHSPYLPSPESLASSGPQEHAKLPLSPTSGSFSVGIQRPFGSRRASATSLSVSNSSPGIRSSLRQKLHRDQQRQESEQSALAQVGGGKRRLSERTRRQSTSAQSVHPDEDAIEVDEDELSALADELIPNNIAKQFLPSILQDGPLRSTEIAEVLADMSEPFKKLDAQSQQRTLTRALKLDPKRFIKEKGGKYRYIGEEIGLFSPASYGGAGIILEDDDESNLSEFRLDLNEEDGLEYRYDGSTDEEDWEGLGAEGLRNRDYGAIGRARISSSPAINNVLTFNRSNSKQKLQNPRELQERDTDARAATILMSMSYH